MFISAIYEHRLFIICDKHVNEDEFHYVLIVLHIQCIVFLQYIDTELATIFTFYNVFNSSEKEVLRLVKYICYAFIIRETRLMEINA